MSEDPHSPTAAGPDPEGAEPAAVPLPEPEPPEAVAQAPVPPAAEPTPTVSAADASFSQPAGSALLGDGAGPVDPHPEKRVGAAFAGGLVAALFLKGLARRKHA